MGITNKNLDALVVGSFLTLDKSVAEKAGLVIENVRLDRIIESIVDLLSEKIITVAQKTILTRSLLSKHINEFVTVDTKARDKGYKIHADDEIVISIDKLKALADSVLANQNSIVEIQPDFTPDKLKIVYENEDFLVIDKRAGSVVHPAAGVFTGTIANLVRGYLTQKGEYDESIDRAGIVHRLDRGVSGFMVIAKNLESQTELKRAFKDHEVFKLYSATVEKIDKSPFSTTIENRINGALTIPLDEISKDSFGGEIESSLLQKLLATESYSSWVRVEGYIGRDIRFRQRMAFTEARRVEADREALTYILPLSKIRFLIRILTGRTHQIRATLAYCGYKILGDDLYGSSVNLRRLTNNSVIALRSSALAFTFKNKSYLFSEKF